MGTKHTPGPWRISTGNDRWIVQEDGGCIACVEIDKQHGSTNADLIAAAPELLSAGQALNLVAVMMPGTDGRELVVPRVEFDALLAAIAKATGAKP